MNSQLFQNICFYHVVESTQNLAKEMLRDGLITQNTAIVAKRQTAGMGRIGRKWISTPGGLWCSLIILEPNLGGAPAITILAGIVVHRTIRNLCPAAPLWIKWPNDIFYGDQKVAGILVSQVNYKSSHKNQPATIIGIGININQKQFPPAIRDNATSLRLETGKRAKIKKVLQSLLAEFEKAYPAYTSGKLSGFIDYFHTYDYLASRMIRLSHDKNEYIGIANGISNNGALIVQFPDNCTREFVSAYKIDIIY